LYRNIRKNKLILTEREGEGEWWRSGGGGWGGK